jgi:FkbM family methyltransferase
MIFIPRNDIEWKDVNYLAVQFGEGYYFNLTLNRPLADWDTFDYWERERVEHMLRNLEKGEIFFDVGTEQGWCNLAYANIVGPENMVLMEPTPEFWANIHALWYKNFDVDPKGFYEGLISNKTTDTRTAKEFNTWGKAYKDPIIDRNKYTYIHENTRNVPEITIDDYVDKTGIVPNVISIDIEGAEILAIQGAKKTLTENDVKVYISIHDDLGNKYKVKPGQVQNAMYKLGYKGDHLGTDHEAHWYFRK